MEREEKVKIYEKAIADKCPNFEKKGKTMPYTSANTHMFSLINKKGELGIRFSKEVQKKYIEELGTNLFYSYNSIMHGYVLMPESIWEDTDLMAKYLNEGYDYVMTLDPK